MFIAAGTPSDALFQTHLDQLYNHFSQCQIDDLARSWAKYFANDGGSFEYFHVRQFHTDNSKVELHIIYSNVSL